MDQSIIPECFVDTNLIETLAPPQKQYNHQKGCNVVCTVMKNKFADRFAVGIIDKDKYEVDYLKEFTIICNRGGLVLHKHTTRHHYMIQISPAMETFILTNAAAVGIQPVDFGLPADIQKLKKETKTVNSKNDDRFKRLFRTMQQAGAEDIIRLSAWIKYLKQYHYETDMAALQAL